MASWRDARWLIEGSREKTHTRMVELAHQGLLRKQLAYAIGCPTSGALATYFNRHGLSMAKLREAGNVRPQE